MQEKEYGPSIDEVRFGDWLKRFREKEERMFQQQDEYLPREALKTTVTPFLQARADQLYTRWKRLYTGDIYSPGYIPIYGYPFRDHIRANAALDAWEQEIIRFESEPFRAQDEADYHAQIKRAQDERKRAQDERKRAQDERKRAQDERRRREVYKLWTPAVIKTVVPVLLIFWAFTGFMGFLGVAVIVTIFLFVVYLGYEAFDDRKISREEASK